MYSKHLRTCLDSAAAIAGLLPQAERLIELRRIYSKLVPQQLLRSSAIANYRQQNVVIFAENNAVAAKLRLLSPRLVNDFVKCGVQVTGIRLEVQPRPEPLKQTGPKRAKLSRAGAERLEALARRLPESKLKQTLARMAAQSDSAQEADQATGDQGQKRPIKPPGLENA